MDIQEQWEESASSGRGVITRYPVKEHAKASTPSEDSTEPTEKFDKDDYESGSEDLDDILEEMEKLDLEELTAQRERSSTQTGSSSSGTLDSKQGTGLRKGFLLPKASVTKDSRGKSLKSALKQTSKNPSTLQRADVASGKNNASNASLGTSANTAFTGSVLERNSMAVGDPRKDERFPRMEDRDSASPNVHSLGHRPFPLSEPSQSPAQRVSRFKMTRSQ